MKIAIATNDRKTIAKRTGRAKEFAIFNIDPNGNIKEVVFVENEHKHHDEHDHEHEPNHRKVTGYGKGHGTGLGSGHRKGGRHHHHEIHLHEAEHHHHDHGVHHHNEIIDQLKGIDMLLVRAVGKYLRQDLIDGNIPFKTVTKEDDLEKIIKNYLEN